MPPLYKESVYWLVLLALTGAVYLALAIFLGPRPALGAFGLLGLAGFQPLLYCKRGKAVLWDERDALINYRAVLAAYASSWLVFTLGGMGLWAAEYSFAGRSTISVHVLPVLVMAGFLVVATVRAIAIVVQYRLQNAGKGA
jgi:alpha-beta hydrolase superfamily lysophospholipase